MRGALVEREPRPVPQGQHRQQIFQFHQAAGTQLDLTQRVGAVIDPLIPEPQQHAVGIRRQLIRVTGAAQDGVAHRAHPLLQVRGAGQRPHRHLREVLPRLGTLQMVALERGQRNRRWP